MRKLAILWSLVLMAGCSAATQSQTSTPLPSESPTESEAPFAAAAQAFLRYTCSQPTGMESTFCTDVDIDGLTVEGNTLTVPASLDAASTDRLAEICEDLAGSDLQPPATAEGVKRIVVAGEGGEQAECRFRAPAP